MLGLEGPQGPPGAQGPAGPPQALDVQTVVNQWSAGPGLARTEAACPEGYSLTGGGAGTGDGRSVLIDSSPACLTGGNCWAVIYDNPPEGAVNVAFGLCIRLL